MSCLIRIYRLLFHSRFLTDISVCNNGCFTKSVKLFSDLVICLCFRIDHAGDTSVTSTVSETVVTETSTSQVTVETTQTTETTTVTTGGGNRSFFNLLH